jgi:Mitochondrial K+-H+ exchange-related
MRLFLLPLTHNRVLIYCDKLHPKPILPALSSPKASSSSPSSSDKQSSPEPQAPVPSFKTVFFPPAPPTPTANSPNPEESTILDRATDFAAYTWTKWEKEPSGISKRITLWGNALLRRIPYEEWALKSFPPLTTRRKEEYGRWATLSKSGTSVNSRSGTEKKVKLIYPRALGLKGQPLEVAAEFARSRQDLHWRRMVGSIIGAPLTLPFALVPVYATLCYILDY